MDDAPAAAKHGGPLARHDVIAVARGRVPRVFFTSSQSVAACQISQ
jgi:hypothetical protein